VKIFLADFRENIGYPEILDERMYKTGVNERGSHKIFSVLKKIWIIFARTKRFR
jgi:hypothetical protein